MNKLETFLEERAAKSAEQKARMSAAYEKNKKIFVGDISAVLLKNLPYWAKTIRTPKLGIAMMPEWEKKIKLMVEITSKKNVTSLSGVPTWTIVLIKEILSIISLPWMFNF